MGVFLVLGVLGLAVIAVSLVVGDLLDGALSALEADWISTAAVGGFVSAFGFGAAAADGGGLPLPLALTVGAVSGAAVGWLALWLTRVLKDGPSDGTVTVADAVGRTARVVTAIPSDGYGVVRVVVGGHSLQLNARSAAPVEAGLDVDITGVVSPTAVSVAPVWRLDPGLGGPPAATS